MLSLRPAIERGHSQLSWLDSRHSFSFDQYHDPRHMAFGPLRVINEDIINGGGGFGTHPHRDMEIITYVIDGQLRHEDSLGNGSLISPGEIQKMSAGQGVRHSEFNVSKQDPVHLLQIWIIPDELNLPPSYEQKSFKLEDGSWLLLGGPDGDGLISIRQNVKLWALKTAVDTMSTFKPQPGSKLWIQMVKGACSVGTAALRAGDGLAQDDDAQFEIRANQPAELLLFEILK